MMPDLPTILAFDTSAPHCAAALLREGRVVSDRIEPMQRGQAERLFPMLEEMLSDAGLAWSDLDAVGVGIGPGNFTGIRIAVSAARGLALSLGIPAIGVSSFEIMAFGVTGDTDVLVSLEAPRGQAYVQPVRRGNATGAARLVDPEAPPSDLVIGPLVVGNAARVLARHGGADARPERLVDMALRIARIAERRLGETAPPDRPAPLYVRAADAAPSRDAPPVILA